MINERKLSKAELKKREDIIMKMKGNKRDLVKKYGKDAEAVMYGRATNMAKKQTKEMRDPKITELIKDALKNPKKADLDKDGKLSDYEKTRGAAIEKAMDKDKVKEDYDGPDLESGAYGDPKVGNYDITSQSDNEASDIEALAAAGLEESFIGDKKLSDLKNMGTADINLWHVFKLIDAGILDDSDRLKALKALDPSRKLDEDIDIGHEDNEPGMLQGDLYEIGKASMEIYAMLDDMEGEGEIDLPSWWQSKVYKAKEAIVGAAEYLDFELKEPAIDAVVDKVAPLDINVDPLGETVEDYITSVDDLTEIEIPSTVITKIAAEINSPKTAASVILRLVNAILDKESADYSKNQKMGRALDLLKDLADDKEEESVEEMSNANSNYGSNEDSNENSNDNPESYSGLKKFVAEKLARDLKEGLPKGFFDKAMKAKDEVDESFDSLVKKVDKSKGYDKKDAQRVAGFIANRKRAGAGSGPTAKMKKREKIKEDYASLVSKLKKQGKSEKAAKAIAGAMASYKAKGGGKGPTAKQAKRAK